MRGLRIIAVLFCLAACAGEAAGQFPPCRLTMAPCGIALPGVGDAYPPALGARRFR